MTYRAIALDVWIPGDWGYVDNLAQDRNPGRWPKGLEGESIIVTRYKGGEPLFYGHFPGRNERTLDEWVDEVASWTSNTYLRTTLNYVTCYFAYPTYAFVDEPADARVKDSVQYPRTGLE